jgi:2-dehydro-3-deoxygluconokinase
VRSIPNRAEGEQAAGKQAAAPAASGADSGCRREGADPGPPAPLDLVALGEPLLVLLPERSGPLRSVPRFERALAGAECNVLLGMARLGGRVGLIARLGADEFGEFALETLRASSVDVRYVQADPARPTGLYFKEIDPLNLETRAVYYRSGSAASALKPADVPADYIRGARAFLTTGISALLSPAAYEAVGQALRAARDAGVRTYFDPNLRPRLWGSGRAAELLRPLLSDVDVYLGGAQETRVLTSDHNVRDLGSAVRELGPGEVVIKLGDKGAVASYDDESYEVPALPGEFREATGAGDGFNAGYLWSRLGGGDIVEAMRAGTICGASVCAGVGDWETFPRLETLMNHLRRYESG